MSLTTVDTKTMKGLLNELRQEIAKDTDQKINIALAGLEREQKAQRVTENTRLRKEIQTLAVKMDNRFDTMNRRFDKIDQRFDAVDQVLNDIVEAVLVDGTAMYSDHETRIKRLEQHISAV